MGGCRCTYGNCCLRTDGKTHMFHYPVFDKVRCHQWLTNAHKLEFLNLKVSQLKNRVVCQHHFRDENFMNFRKDKLTFDAVPTEDGPFCDSNQLQDKKPEQEDLKGYSISLDDIENDYLTIIDKKANFSVKYGDFLTNCDLMELNSLNQTPDKTQIALQCPSMLEQCHIKNPKDQVLPSAPVKNVTHILNKNNRFEYPCSIILNNNTNTKPPVIIPSQNEIDVSKNVPTQGGEEQNPMNLIFNISHVPIEYDDKSVNQNVNTNQSFEVSSKEYKSEEPKQINEPKNNSLLKKKITIISEKKISEPVPLIGDFKPLTPTKVLPLPNRKKKILFNPVEMIPEVSTNVTDGMEGDLTGTLNNNIVVEKPQSDLNNKLYDSENQKAPQNIIINEINKINYEGIPKTSLIKNKIPPERVAAIAEKRKFNMKLRDIVEDCLDKLEEPDKSIYDNRKHTPKSKTTQNNTQKVSSYLGKEQELPSVHEYTIAYLEARMKKMENTLLSKIDQNSKKITELKQTFSPPHKKKNVHTQTTLSEVQHKKQLYHEISKYLSQDANNLIYEELFINKYKQQTPKSSYSPKRRKCK